MKKHQAKCKKNVSRNSQNDTSECTNNVDGITEHQATIFPWSYSGTSISLLTINRIYDKIVSWRKNHFLLPIGSTMKKYMDETIRLMNERLQDSPVKDICFKANMSIPSILLQKPSGSSKSKDH